MSIKIIGIFFLVLCFSLLDACYQNNAEWKGSIEEVDGVTVVKNPIEPLNPELQIVFEEEIFSLEEELSIGEVEGREEYMFSLIIGIAIDEEERIYIVDYDEANVKIFDTNGEHIKTFGEQGLFSFEGVPFSTNSSY